MKGLTKGSVVIMSPSSGVMGWGNPQCISSVTEALGTISLYGHNEHYKTYDVAEILESPTTAQAAKVAELEGKLLTISEAFKTESSFLVYRAAASIFPLDTGETM